jgi:lysine 2,3-aminomutase
MLPEHELDLIAINVHSHRILDQLLNENSILAEIMHKARNETEALIGVREWVESEASPQALEFHKSEHTGMKLFESLEWRDYATIRLLDYIDHADMEFVDLNLRGQLAISNPIRMIWLAVTHGTGGARPDFFQDMLMLLQQFSGKYEQKCPDKSEVLKWMERFPSGLDPRMVVLREENRERIINILIDKIDSRELQSSRFKFDAEMTRKQKFERMLEWWDDHRFHLGFAIRDPDLLNEMLGYSLDPDTMDVLYEARDKGIPFFVNPYYLSLLHVRVPHFAIGADLAMRYYVVYSQQLVDEFGHISAWEKEDEVEPGKPNAAGWILPSSYNVHRRYPDVAILIPDTLGRACGGLCASCQRMYEFQRGNLNFNLHDLLPDETWQEKLDRLMQYFEEDSHLRDILITGGDALMSSDTSLEVILDAVFRMAVKKKEANRKRVDGEKYAEILRVRIGTRLPAYLPQRITPDLVKILAEFKEKASEAGVRQFMIQTHFEAPLEITPEVRRAVRMLNEAGWTVTNQHVFTAAASRRGHTAKLRQVLNDVGILPYYTFSVKGYMENTFNFATNARAVQEQLEEKRLGAIPQEYHERIRELPLEPEIILDNIEALRKESGLPFLATDRNVLNLPAVGKSMTFRVIGITRYGRRILEFDHDRTRSHSPIIDRMGRVMIIESKSIYEYLEQLAAIGEDISEYRGIYGYSIGETEPRLSMYEYPEYDYQVTEEITNLELPT